MYSNIYIYIYMPCKTGSIAILKVLRVHCYGYIEQSHSMHCIYTFLNRDNKLCVLCSPEMYGYSVPLNAGGYLDQLDAILLYAGTILHLGQAGNASQSASFGVTSCKRCPSGYEDAISTHESV